jgi:hypothetical protein
MKRVILFAAAAVIATPTMAAQLGAPVDARSTIIGMQPTGNVALPATGGGGDAKYFANMKFADGIPALIMDYGLFTSGPNIGLAARFICSGSHINGNAIVTAAHCVSPRTDTSLASPQTTAYFYRGTEDIRVPFNELATAVSVQTININPGYTGLVIDHNDIAVLQLATAAPGWANEYRLTNLTDLRGQDFEVYGYGGRSTVGGGSGVLPINNARTGFLRTGTNTFDYRMGDPIFSQIQGNGWQTVFPNNPNIAFSYISDFDSGFAVNDMACRVAQASNLAQAAGAVFCHVGTGSREVTVAGGDSGGPSFVDGRLATVTSYGLTFGTPWGDCLAGLNNSCGEMNGFVPVYIHRDWIEQFSPGAFTVPEASTWAMLIAGFGLVGAAARRRHAIG